MIILLTITSSGPLTLFSDIIERKRGREKKRERPLTAGYPRWSIVHNTTSDETNEQLPHANFLHQLKSSLQPRSEEKGKHSHIPSKIHSCRNVSLCNTQPSWLGRSHQPFLSFLTGAYFFETNHILEGHLLPSRWFGSIIQTFYSSLKEALALT